MFHKYVQYRFFEQWGALRSYANERGIRLVGDIPIFVAPDSADLENTDATAVTILGIVAYYDHYWSDHWSSSIGYSMHDNDPLNQQAASEFQTGQYASANLLYTPYPELLIGSELLWGNLENVGGEDADDYRVQFTFKHKFGKRF